MGLICAQAEQASQTAQIIPTAAASKEAPQQFSQKAGAWNWACVAYATMVSHNSMDAPPLVLGLVTLQVLMEVPTAGAVLLCALSTAAWLHATQAPGRAHAHAAGSLMLPVATSLVGNDQSNGTFGCFRLHLTLCDDHGVPFIPHPAQFSSLPVRSILEPQHTCKSIWYNFPL